MIAVENTMEEKSMKKILQLFIILTTLFILSGSINSFAGCKTGNKAKVLWKGTWYAATVTKTNGAKCFIHYDGYENKWDEWVGPGRIKIAGTAPIAVDTAEIGIGDSVQVNWKGAWYPAKVLEANNGKYKIHYDGYGDNWDEWVGNDRIKK